MDTHGRPTQVLILIFIGVSSLCVNGTSLYDVNQDHQHDELLSRHRRSTGLTITDTAAVYTAQVGPVTDITFTLKSIPDVVSAGVGVGEKLQFVLFIEMPSGDSDLLVELFAPDSDNTIMKLCHVEILTTTGVDLTYDAAVAQPVLDAKDGTTNYDRAVLDFGTVSNGGTNNPAINGMIQIVWEAVMLNDGSTVNGDTYHVSAGAEYNGETEIWVGQYSFPAVVDSWTPAATPSFTLSGPTNIAYGTTGEFQLDMFLPEAYTEISMDVFAPLNGTTDVMSVCLLSAIAVDTVLDHAYNCHDFSNIEYTTELSPSGLTNDYGNINLGELINARAREEDADTSIYTITVKFVMYVTDDETLLGQSFKIGSAVLVGTDKIWAGQSDTITVGAPPALGYADMVTLPTLVLRTTANFTGTPVVALGQAIMLELEMEVTPNEESMYRLEANMPGAPGVPNFRVCKIAHKESGVNIPCLTKKEPVYSASAGNTRPDINDVGVWDIGYIKNPGYVTNPEITDRNKVTFTIAISAVNDSTVNTDGLQVSVPIGMLFSNQPALSIISTTIEISTAASSAVTAYPTGVLAYDTLVSPAYIGEARKVDMILTFTPGVAYQPMIAEILTLVDVTAQVSVCKVEITRVGGGMGCYDVNNQNASFEYSSRQGDDTYDRVVLAMEAVESLAADSDAANESEIVITAYVKLEEHASNVHGALPWVGAGILFQDNRIWVASEDLEVDTTNIPQLVIPPYVSIVRHNDTTLDVGQGMPVVYDIIVKTNGMESIAWKVDATVTGDLSMCFIRVLEYGTNFPCGDTDLEHDLVPEADGFTFLSGTLDGKVATNLGAGQYVANDIFDENTIRIQVGAQMSDISTIGNPSTMTIDFEYYDSTAAWNPTNAAFNLLTIATPTLEADNSTLPGFDVYMGDINWNMSLRTPDEISKGETKLVRIDLDMPNITSVSKMEVKFLTPSATPGLLQICDVNVVNIGENLPCLNKKRFLNTETIVSRTGSSYTDIGSMDLGYVCHWPFSDEEGASKLTVEAVIRLTLNNTLSPGDVVNLATTVKINDQLIYVQQYPITVAAAYTGEIDNITVQGVDMDYNGTTTDLNWKPGEYYTLPFVVTVPLYLVTTATIDVQLPVYNSSVATLHSMNFSTSGRNLGCLSMNVEEEYEPDYQSSLNTSQMDRMILDLGLLTNSAQTWRNGVENDTTEWDNQFLFEVEMQMADALENTDGSVHQMSVGLSAADMVVVIVSVDITVTRDADARPILVFEAEVNETLQYNPGDQIPVTALLKHDNQTSRAECSDLVIAFYYPVILQFDDASWTTNCTHSGITFANASMLAGKLLWWDALYFTDICEFSFTLVVTDETLSDMASQQLAVTPYQVCSYMIHRASSSTDDGKVLCEEMMTMQVMANINAEPACDVVELGMQDGTITDCQITGSDCPDPAMMPHNGRLGGSSQWKAGMRSGAYPQYMQVDFARMLEVTSVILEYPGAGARVASIHFEYSGDGDSWTSGDTVPVEAGYDTTEVDVQTPWKARFIRLNVESDSADAVQLRVEFKGCVDAAFDPITDPCPTVTSLDFPPRCFLATSSSVYVCDVDRTDQTMSRCYTSSDGSSWLSMDINVRHISGWDRATGNVYGIASDGATHIVSADNGVTWGSVAQTHMVEVQAESTYTLSIAVPPYAESEMSPGGTPADDYSMGNWGAAYGGIYQNPGAWQKVVDWTACCL